LLSRTGATDNNYLYTGEQWDNDLGMYFLRARYMEPDKGRFWTQDSFEGNFSEPLRLHKYTYCQNNSINMVDYSGEFGISAGMVFTTVQAGFVLYGSYSTTKNIMAGNYKEAAVEGVFTLLDITVVGIISKAFTRLGFTRFFKLGLKGFSEWGKRGVLVRRLYNSRVAFAQQHLKDLVKEGKHIDEIKKIAFSLRESAQKEARLLMTAEDIAELEAGNLAKYGRKSGLTFEEFDKMYQTVEEAIRASGSPSKAVNWLFLIFHL
jgi:RHS repeat-associated protein